MKKLFMLATFMIAIALYPSVIAQNNPDTMKKAAFKTAAKKLIVIVSHLFGTKLYEKNYLEPDQKNKQNNGNSISEKSRNNRSSRSDR